MRDNTKKGHTSKVLRGFLALALAVVMGLGTAIPAFADDGEGAIIGNENKPATAAITKMLVMPEGTTTPEVDFEFTFTPQSYNESEEPADLAKMPKVNTNNKVVIPFTADDTKAAENGITSIPKESLELTDKIPFTNAGVYTYTITEVENRDWITDATKELMDYSGASYNITFWVRDKTEGTGVYVHAIASKIVVKDTPGQGEPGTKVDPTPGFKTPEPGDYSQMIFTNTYHKITGGEDFDDAALSISNEVTQPGANTTTLYFSYNVLLTKPATLNEQLTLQAYIVSGDEIVTSAAHGATPKIDDDGKPYIEVTTGTAATILLKHGEKIVFKELYVGTQYSAVQAAQADYTPKVTIVVNGGSEPIVLNNTIGKALSTETRIIGDKTNSAAFSNAFKEVLITGIIVNNLPFVLVLVLAAGGLGVFVTAKSRKRNQTQA